MIGNGIEVTVIMPTVADIARRETIARALGSIIAQEGVAVVPLVVVNGNRFDRELLAQLKARKDLRFHYREEPGLVGALRTGRELVDTPFYSFLDDDDEYLPHALRSRMAVMRSREDVDVVVGNGYRMRDGKRSASAWNIEEAKIDPIKALLANNWLTSCGGLYRSARIGPEYFSDIPSYAEWTYLAYKLCLTRTLAFLNYPGYIINFTPGSLSGTTAYGMSQVNVLRQVLQLSMPPGIRSLVRAKYGAALHDMAAYHLAVGNRRRAWACHLSSLCQPRGARYAAYTRRLIGF